MTQIQFYHLLATPLERALPKLLNKALEAKFRVLLVVDSEERAEFFDQHLWTGDHNGFLPHGRAQDARPERQPVLITTSQNTDLNEPNLLCITDGSTTDNPSRFNRILDIFDGHNPESVSAARARWKHYSALGLPVAYFKQTDKGGWEHPKAA